MSRPRDGKPRLVIHPQSSRALRPSAAPQYSIKDIIIIITWHRRTGGSRRLRSSPARTAWRSRPSRRSRRCRWSRCSICHAKHTHVCTKSVHTCRLANHRSRTKLRGMRAHCATVAVLIGSERFVLRRFCALFSSSSPRALLGRASLLPLSAGSPESPTDLNALG
jgi:hypothetical protein